MRLSVCPECYQAGKIIQGRFLNEVRVNFVYQYCMFHCDKCKRSYKEK